MKPTFSIIMPAYNEEEYIGRAIESVLKQKYDNWELLIVDDASRDGTAEVVDRYTDGRIRYLRNQVNKGLGGTRNVAIQQSQGDWLCLLDADDVLPADSLLVKKSCITDTSSLILTDMYVWLDGEKQYIRQVDTNSVDEIYEFFKRDKSKRILSGINMHPVTWRRSAELLFIEDRQQAYHHDYVFVLQLLCKFRATIVHVPTYEYFVQQTDSLNAIERSDPIYFQRLEEIEVDYLPRLMELVDVS